MHMRSGAVLAIISAVLLSVAVAAPALARSSVATAYGEVDWNSDSDGNLERTSAFWVRDGTPGQASREGDSGWYSLEKSNGGSMTMNVACVRIDDGWAEFAGQIVEATLPFTVGEWFMVSIKDGGRSGDEIGMKAKNGPRHACEGGPTCAIGDNGALDECQLDRQGHVTGGDIRIRRAR